MTDLFQYRKEKKIMKDLTEVLCDLIKTMIKDEVQNQLKQQSVTINNPTITINPQQINIEDFINQLKKLIVKQ